MVWGLTIFGVLLLLIVLFLLLPLQLYINTDSNQYFAQMGYVAKASLQGDEAEILRVKMQILGYRFFLYPLRRKKDLGKKGSPRNKSRRKKPGGRWFIQILKAFSIRKFELNLDTGDYVINAKLYPLFGLVNPYLANCKVNYQGNNYVVCDLRSRPWKILRSFIHL